MTWNVHFAEGGQQNLRTYSVNCGVYCLEWIKFRATTAVRSRLLREREQGRRYIIEKLTESRMKDLEPYAVDSRRLCMASEALDSIKELSLERN